jgi:hypothetical protein
VASIAISGRRTNLLASWLFEGRQAADRGGQVPCLTSSGARPWTSGLGKAAAAFVVAWDGTGRDGVVWCGVVWYGMVWYGM